jgi:alpha-galactosidase
MAISAAAPAVAATSATAPGSFVDILRGPDSVTAFLDGGPRKLARTGAAWTSEGILVKTEVRGKELPVEIEAESSPLLRIRLRWDAPVPEQWRILNDHWERSYGDLEWRGMIGERVLPWYFLAFDGRCTHGYGVATGCAAFVFWQVDAEGISLWLDLRNGGSSVRLGPRRLEAAKVRIQRGNDGERAFQAAHRFCRRLCDRPVLPADPVYGGNNWYYTYGRDCSAAAIERESDLVAEWAPAARNRPFMVIDDGWAPNRVAGPWEHGNERFPDMPGLAASMKRRGVRPGIWMRPLCTAASVPQTSRLRLDRAGRAVLDPTIPEVMESVRQDIRRMVAWGYELVKHDFSSFDLLGRWGFAMHAELTDAGWHFSDRSRTTAEVVLALYRAIREAAGSALVIGCNTFGHLCAGMVELQRTGDDTSGREFHRTRRMGVNTLAFRGPQHRAFFDLDADCAPITPAVPWQMALQWLDLAARSGTALFVSADPATLTRESVQAIRRAFAAAAQRRGTAEPLDWMSSTTPSRWRIDGQTVAYKWYGSEGGTPFPK